MRLRVNRASEKQINYIMFLSEMHGLGYDISDFQDEENQINISKPEASKIIQDIKKDAGEHDPCDLMRKKIISMAYTLNWTVYNPNNPEKPKADMNRINKWCMQYGQYKKTLNQHTAKELPHLVSQFQHKLLKKEMTKHA